MRNCRPSGLRVDRGYEIIAQNVYARCDKSGLAGNVGIYINVGDSHYTDCVIVDYTTGVVVRNGGANRLTRVHVWGGPVPPARPGEDREMLVDSIAFDIGGGDTILRDCYADTAKRGFVIRQYAQLFGCSYFNNYGFKLDDVLCIDHVNTNAHLIVSGCRFAKTSPKATIYRGAGKKLIWRDNFYTGFPPDAIPVFDGQ